MENTFLPTGEKAPEGNYFKLREGENTFRVVSSAITGYEYWNSEKKPTRLKKQPTSMPADIRIENGKPSPIKYFWAFIIYNYVAEKCQILEITQASIQNAIRALVQNKKWGVPQGYDITINRTGSGMETEYTVMPSPHSEFPAEKINKNINLEALFSNQDPFMPKEYNLDNVTPNTSVEEDMKNIEPPAPDFLS